MDRKKMKRLADRLLKLHDDREELIRSPRIVRILGLTAWIDCHGIVVIHGNYYTVDQLCLAIENARVLRQPVICRGDYYYQSGVCIPSCVINPSLN